VTTKRGRKVTPRFKSIEPVIPWGRTYIPMRTRNGVEELEVSGWRQKAFREMSAVEKRRFLQELSVLVRCEGVGH
jgi:hypothetical protein